ncbi:MAG: CoA-binding protein [Dehalococcoidales bacterium]|nr:CoA-binding protein [Dehalococcoidales bacterium]
MTLEEEILKNNKVVAIVGLSSNPERPSNRVGVYLKANGYKVIPVNPMEKSILGETSYPDLRSIPQKVDVVDIFRKPEDVLPIAIEAVAIGAKVVWMQEGIVNEAAAEYARKAGLKVVMDHCMRKELMKLKGEKE